MVTKHRMIGVAAAAAGLLLLTATGRAASTRTQETPGANYAWADACKDCHTAIYESWQKTKHARAISRLSGAEQQKECVNCHVTSGPGKIEKDGQFVNANIQCESCHGPAAAHAAEPEVRTGLVRKPKADVCEACHSTKSPHYRGFYYSAMIGLSHQVAK